MTVTAKVEIAFASDPLSTTPTWVDVTSHVRHSPGVRVSRGRSDEYGKDSGTASFRLSNRTRLFDPSYASGTYFGQLLPRRQVRITATSNSVSYPVFYGFVAGWPQSFGAGGKDAWVDVECIDGMAWFADTRLSSEPYGDYVRAIADPMLWLRNVTSDGQWIDYGTGGYDALLLGGGSAQPPAVEVSSQPGINAGQAVRLNGASWWNVLGSPISDTDTSWTLCAWVNVASSGEYGFPLLGYEDPSTSDEYYPLFVDADGTLSTYNVVGTPTSASTAFVIADGRWHHVALVVTTNVPQFFVDGQPVVTDVTLGAYPFYAARIAASGQVGVAPVAAWNGSFEDVLVFDAALTAAQVAALHNLSAGNFNESSTARITRYLDDSGWPAAWRDLTATPRATVGRLVYAGQQVLTALQEVEDSEQGRVFISRAGAVLFYSRYAVQEVARCSTVQATLSSDGSDSSYQSAGFVANDDLLLANDVTITTPTAQARSTDSTSITAHGRQSQTINTILSTYEQASSMAAGLLYQRKDVATRTDPITVNVKSQSTTERAKLLALELHDRVRFEITPMGLGSQVAVEQTVQRLEWTFTADNCELRVTGSTIRPGFFVLGTSVLGTGRLGY